MKKVLFGILVFLIIYFVIQGINCVIGTRKAKEKLSSYVVKEKVLSYGIITYIDEGEGEVILSVHGIMGGYDQAYENVKNRITKNRVIAASRFGYLGSDVKGDGNPKEQATAFKELLDELEIDKVFVLATSAGGTSAIRFSLDYPEKVKGLILFCSAMPLNENPDDYLEYQAPPEILLSDYAMYLISPFMPIVMGLPSSTVKTILPINERKEGVIIDGKLTNPDMERNFDDYLIEELKIPVLILHSKDDKVVEFSKVENVKDRFLNLKLVAFSDGGHMMKGHGEEIDKELDEFINKYK